MAVLFPTPFGHTLNPAKQAEMLQGFLNIENAEGVTNGKLTKADMADYAQKRFFAADPNSAVASYLTTNFDTLANLGSKDNTIGVEDLVQLQTKLPKIPPVTNPPVNTPPPSTTNPNNFTVTPIFIPIAFQNGNLGANLGQPVFSNNLNTQSIPQLITWLFSQMLQMFSNLF